MVIYKAVDIVRRSEGFFLFRAIILNFASIPEKLLPQCKYFFNTHISLGNLVGEPMDPNYFPTYSLFLPLTLLLAFVKS